jgi:DNA-directed RNA polymerase subunit RPC12/RpoP
MRKCRKCGKRIDPGYVGDPDCVDWAIDEMRTLYLCKKCDKLLRKLIKKWLKK